MREFQLNTVSTNYHYKFPIYKYQNIQKSGLKNTLHSNILEEWTTMNHWIHKYLSVKNAQNIWEIKYIETYNYLLEEDIVYNNQTKLYHKSFFKYINIDIKHILNYNQKNKKLDIIDLLNTEKMNLGNIICNFALKILKKEKILDSNNNLINSIKKYII